MLYAYLGTDTKRTNDTLLRAVASMSARVPNANVQYVTSETEFLDIASLLSASGLFYPSQIVVLDGVCERKESKAELFSFLPEMAASSHLFFVREESLTSPEIKKLEKAATKLVRYDAGEVKEAKFNIFSLSDALLTHDKKQLWVRLALALRAGEEPEALHGVLFSAAKSMVLAEGTQTPEETGLHPFVFKKARAAGRKYSVEEMQTLVKELAVLPHEARRNGFDLEYALELFALGSTVKAPHAA